VIPPDNCLHLALHGQPLESNQICVTAQLIPDYNGVMHNSFENTESGLPLFNKLQARQCEMEQSELALASRNKIFSMVDPR